MYCVKLIEEGAVSKYNLSAFEQLFKMRGRLVYVWLAVAVVSGVAVISYISRAGLGLFPMLLVVLLFSSTYYLGVYHGATSNTKWWRKRVERDDDAAQEYAALVTWTSSSIGLESLNPIEFKKKS